MGKITRKDVLAVVLMFAIITGCFWAVGKILKQNDAMSDEEYCLRTVRVSSPHDWIPVRCAYWLEQKEKAKQDG